MTGCSCHGNIIVIIKNSCVRPRTRRRTTKTRAIGDSLSSLELSRLVASVIGGPTSYVVPPELSSSSIVQDQAGVRVAMSAVRRAVVCAWYEGHSARGPFRGALLYRPTASRVSVLYVYASMYVCVQTSLWVCLSDSVRLFVLVTRDLLCVWSCVF